MPKELTLGQLIDRFGALDEKKKNIETEHKEVSDLIKKKIKTPGKHSGSIFEVLAIGTVKKAIIPLRFKRKFSCFVISK